VPELALDQRQRDALVQQLDGMSVAKLMRGEAAAHASFVGDSAQLKPDRAGRPAAAARRAVDYAEHRANGQPGPFGDPWPQR
jgi:hypothetical protein